MSTPTRLTNEVIEIFDEVKLNKLEMTDFETMKIAVLLQRNYLFAKANMLGHENYPVALEKIGMELENISKELNNQ